MVSDDELLRLAWDVRERAVCTFSGFAVGVALLDDNDRTFTGANVENASYNLGLCAERVALYHGLTHHMGAVRRIALVTEAPALTYPCGACRQALWEFAPDAEIILANRDEQRRVTMRDLLPHGFDASAFTPKPKS